MSHSYPDTSSHTHHNQRTLKYDCLNIANEYLHNEREPMNAVELLSKRGSFGMLLAGEIAYEEAWRGTDINPAFWLQLASSQYRDAQESAKIEPRSLSAGNAGRAIMRYVQIPATSVIVSANRLPGEKIVHNMYDNLLDCSYKLVDEDTETHHRDVVRDRTESETEIRGIIGEMAILLLAQRYALREIGCTEEWLPLQSLFSEDHGGDCTKKTIEPAWDVSILTRLGEGPIEKAYKIQVKTSSSSIIETPDVTPVHIHPDLDLRKNAHCVDRQIIIGCYLERKAQGNNDRISSELDARTELLLDILG